MNSQLLLLLLASLYGTSSAAIFSKRNVILKSFKHKTCAGHPGIVHAQELSVSSTSDGDLIIGGGFISGMNLTAPLKVKVSMSRRVLGLNIPMPCFKKFGSCTFENICDFGFPNNQLCPGKLDEHDVPCRCPIEPGKYTLPGAQFSMDPTRWAGLLAGTYSGTARLFANSRPLACYDFVFELQ